MARKNKKQKTLPQDSQEVNDFSEMKKQIVGEVMSEIGNKMDEMFSKMFENMNKTSKAVEENCDDTSVKEVDQNGSKEKEEEDKVPGVSGDLQNVMSVVDERNAKHDKQVSPPHRSLPPSAGQPPPAVGPPPLGCGRLGNRRPSQFENWARGSNGRLQRETERPSSEYTESCQNRVRHQQGTQVLENSYQPFNHLLPSYDSEVRYFPWADGRSISHNNFYQQNCANDSNLGERNQEISHFAPENDVHRNRLRQHKNLSNYGHPEGSLSGSNAGFSVSAAGSERSRFNTVAPPRLTIFDGYKFKELAPICTQTRRQ